jgi:hypothetical protein
LVVHRAPAGDREWQAWLDLDAGGVLNEKTSAHVKQGFQWKENAGELKTVFTDFGLKFKTTGWLTLGAFYRQQFDETDDGEDWREENRPYLDTTLKWKWKNVQFSNRNRVEYRMRGHKEDVFRYRNRMTELFGARISPLELQPYLAQEVFLDENETSPTEASRVRLVAGLRGDPEDQFRFLGVKPREGRHFKADAYLLYETQDNAGGWQDTYVIGVKMGVFF